MNSQRLYAIVYGPEYEDLEYFSDYEKAKKTLVTQTMFNLMNNSMKFYVLLYQYTDNNGIYVKSDIEYFIEYDKLKNICDSKGYTYEHIKANPECLHNLIETC